MSRAAALAAVVLLAGCGSSTRTVTHVERCNGITADLTIHYAICGGHRFVRDGEPLAIGRPPGAKIGHWAKAFLSPDGKTLLAQWSSECELPLAFFVRVRGGVPRVVTGERDWTNAPLSIADGWSQDGRAIVEILRGDCGRPANRGIYLVALDGARTRVEPSR